ncbi:unnamed protein product, partial [marine sediment metagenome]
MLFLGDMGASIIICRNNNAAWLMGNIFIAVCTADGSDPIGIYIPVKKPISVPIIVLALAKALLLLKNDTIKNTIAELAKTDRSITPDSFNS